MRSLALIVLIAMVAAVLWLLRPELFRELLPQTRVEAPRDAGQDAVNESRSPPVDDKGAQHEQAALVQGERGAGLAPAASLPAASSPAASVPAASSPTASSPAAPVSAASLQAAATSRPAAVEREARQYLRTLTRTEPAAVSAERADHFVSGEQVLRLLPESATELTSLARLDDASTLDPDTPITVVRSVEQVERVSPGKLIADSAGDLDAPVQQVLMDESVKETTVRAILERLRVEPETVIRVLRQVEYFEQATPRELLADGSVDRRLPIKIVKGTHGLELSSIRDLLPDKTLSPDALFYVRTVRDTDTQGIWGIVHDGIIKNFARGIAIRRGREINTYKVDIPRDADEVRSDSRSSFLGKLIFDKSRRSYVYNLRDSRMGRNPDRITPGQEIIIVDFEPDELIGIYKHFVDERG